MVLQRQERLSRAVPTLGQPRADGDRDGRDSRHYIRIGVAPSLTLHVTGNTFGVSRIDLSEADVFSCIAPDEPWLSSLIAWLSDYANGILSPLPPILPPLSPLLKAIASIPFGETRSYGALLGPHYAQAVGQACAKNPFALLIPCHRVVAKTGLGGFAYGSEMKKALIDFEASFRKRP